MITTLHPIGSYHYFPLFLERGTEHDNATNAIPQIVKNKTMIVSSLTFPETEAEKQSEKQRKIHLHQV